MEVSKLNSELCVCQASASPNNKTVVYKTAEYDGEIRGVKNFLSDHLLT